MPDTALTSPGPELTYLSGIQALVRLPMLQQVRDAAAGLNTAGFVSGYRGSPLGNLDQSLWKAKNAWQSTGSTSSPASTRSWRRRPSGARSRSTCSPARSTTASSPCGTARAPAPTAAWTCSSTATPPAPRRHGGVLLVVGDDHGAKSSSIPHQSDHIFAAAMMPVLNPAGVQEFLDFGLHGWAMSRFSGCWVGMRAIADTVETSAGVVVDPHRVETRLPADFAMPPGGLSIRWPDPPLDQECRLQR